MSSLKKPKRASKAKSSLRADIEAHPEKYPNLTLKKARKGLTHVTFLGRKPSGTGRVSPPKPPAESDSR